MSVGARPAAGAPARCAVALGSNLGDRAAHLDAAVAALRADPRVRVLAVSPWVETQPVGGPAEQGPFLNGALILETHLRPEELLDLLQELEARRGRDRAREERHGPRTLDLDLLLHGDLRRSGEHLTLPHPGLEERAFVLEPLAAIAPDLLLPGCRLPVRERLARLRAHAAPPARDAQR